MSNQYFSFYYDPVRQGYDTNTWNTITGVPVVVAGQLKLDNAGIIHFADLLRGEAVFSLNFTEPQAGDDVKVGFIENNKGEYAYFKIADDVLTAEISNGTNSKTSVIPWVADWTSVNTEFKIKWEAGLVTFSIGDQFKVCLDDTSGTDAIAELSVPGDPMSLYAHCDSTSPLFINYIDVKGVQSML